MTAKKSQRKRAAPIKKHSMFESKAVKIGLIVIFIAIVIIAAVYIILGGSEEDNEVVGNPIAVFDTTMGTFKVELYQDKMPATCENFIKLANDEFYNGMNFYRVLEGFMIQAGRYYPDGSEKQSPYGNINFEESDVKHVDGAISMASTGDKVGGSAEFFICDGEQKGLDGRYAAFGVTINGLDVVHDIASAEHDNSHPAGGGKPYTDIVINNIIIE